MMEIQCYLIQMKNSNYPDSRAKRNRLVQHQTFEKYKYFQNYEDYLHQGISQHTGHRHKNPLRSKQSANNIQQSQVQQPTYPTSSTIQYYPIKRTLINYEDRQVKQLAPKKKKIIEYVEKKEVQVVPKEVLIKDYYAVQHVRGYVKEVIPEVKIEYTKVSKVVKKQELVPRQKQIVYYPPHMTNLEEIKREAQQHLSKSGVILSYDAEYRPATSTLIPQVESLKVSPIQSYNENKGYKVPEGAYGFPLPLSFTKQTSPKYYRLARPSRAKYLASPSRGKNIKQQVLPIQKYAKYSENITKEEARGSHHTTDYSFAEVDNQRRDTLSSFGKNY